VEQGADPVDERRKARAVRTFREVSNEFMETHVAAKRKGRTYADYESLLRRFIFPIIGNMRIVELRRSDVARLHAKLADTPYTANRALALISSIWNWAAKRDEVPFAGNPAKGIERNPEQGRERFLTSEELSRLGDALREAETIGLPYQVNEAGLKAKHAPKPENRRRVIDPYAIAAIRLLILTGARLQEILTARWSEVDFERGIIHLEDSKTGRKPIYLSAAALSILSALSRIDGNQHVIPGEKENAPRTDLKKPWAAITQAAGLKGLRIHDLRHSFASVGAGASLGLPVIGKLLGHSQPATTARYSHLDADASRRAVEKIGSTISAAIDRKGSAQIVTLDDARSLTNRKGA
jgi:integrase